MYFTRRNKILADSLKRINEVRAKCEELFTSYEDILRITNEKETILLEKETAFSDEIEKNMLKLKFKEEALKKIFNEKSLGFPWMAQAISEYYKFVDFEIAEYLENKSHPAQKSADIVRAISAEGSVLRKQLKVAKNFVNYYETLFPWLTEYVGENLDDLLKSFSKEEDLEDEQTDPVLKYIQRAEYEKFSEEERNQKALDRYLSSKKTPWQIGRDYERYIGYLYEMQNYKVDYQGIVKGLEDLGRDLICKKGNFIEIVQCKCWASHKTIHEKHINQLYGRL